MGRQSGKRLLLIGFIVALLFAIPLTLYVLKQRSNTQSHAEAATTLSFLPTSTLNAPISANVGDSIPLQVYVDPGVNANLVSIVKLEISYDPTKLQPNGTSAFIPNYDVFPTILEGPIYSTGKISVTLSIGTDTTKAIQTPTNAGTITFTALATTDPSAPATVSYVTTAKTDTEIFSIGSNDQSSENVLSTSTPAYISIGVGSTTPTPTPTITPTLVPGAPTLTPTITPTPETNLAVDTPTPISIEPSGTPLPPTATIAATGSTDVAFGAGAILTTLTVIGAILFLVI